MELEAEDQTTWEALCDELKGAAVATITTLLAALWPERHFVFDRRVFSAANGVRIAGGLQGTSRLDPTGAVPIPESTFDDYQEVRSWVLDSCSELGAQPVFVERALYELARSIPWKKGRTWSQYADLIAAEVEHHQNI